MVKQGAFSILIFLAALTGLSARTIEDYLARAENFKEIYRYNEALFYYSKAEKKSILQKNDRYFGRIYRGMGDCYAGKENVIYAKEYYVKSLSYKIDQPEVAHYIADYYYNLRLYMHSLRYYALYDKYRSKKEQVSTDFYMRYAVSMAWDKKAPSRKKARDYLKSISITMPEGKGIGKCYKIIDEEKYKPYDPYKKDENHGRECLENLLRYDPLNEKIYLLLIHYSKKIEYKREWSSRLYYLFGDNKRYQWAKILFHYANGESKRALQFAEDLQSDGSDYYLFLATLLYENGKKYKAQLNEKNAFRLEKENK